MLLLGLLTAGVQTAEAQDRPTRRQLRTYIPPDQLVSFLRTTPFSQFIDFLNPTFEQVTGKQVIDPESRAQPIGIAISGMHFLDALELVLEYNDLTYRETDRFFIIEPAPQPELVVSRDQAVPAAAAAPVREELATRDTREIQIHAVLFELNHSRARDQGVDWNTFFGQQQQGGQQGGGAGGVGGDQSPRFRVRTGRVFQGMEDFLIAPQTMDASYLTSFFRYLEDRGIGETIANPSIAVQSGQEGRIQIGSDIPIQTRDFAGNTLTQFFSTGIIIHVTPTLIKDRMSDTLGAPPLDFIHLDVQVEKSSGRPSGAGLVIDRNTAETQVLLLSGEQTIIGGLYSNETSNGRRGIPILKDLPGWFFGLRYIFGRDQRTDAQKELMIVLQARLVDPLTARAQRPFQEQLLERQRGQTLENIRRVDEGISRGQRMEEPPSRRRAPRSRSEQQ